MIKRREVKITPGCPVFDLPRHDMGIAGSYCDVNLLLPSSAEDAKRARRGLEIAKKFVLLEKKEKHG